MAAALRLGILRHIRIPVQALDRFRPASAAWNPFHGQNRSFSSHGDEHLEREEVVERVLAIVRSFPKLDPSKVGTDSHFQKDLGLDSLDNVEIVMALEEEFKLEIPDKEADKIDSCSVAIDFVKEQLIVEEKIERCREFSGCTGFLEFYDGLEFSEEAIGNY